MIATRPASALCVCDCAGVAGLLRSVERKRWHVTSICRSRLDSLSGSRNHRRVRMMVVSQSPGSSGESPGGAGRIAVGAMGNASGATTSSRM